MHHRSSTKRPAPTPTRHRVGLLLLAVAVALLLVPGPLRVRCVVATGSLACCCASAHEDVPAQTPECCRHELPKHDGQPANPDDGSSHDDGDEPCGCQQHEAPSAPPLVDADTGETLPPFIAAPAHPLSLRPTAATPTMRGRTAWPPPCIGPPKHVRFGVFLI